MENILWYRSPASEWNNALPVGNGKLGGMVFGRAEHELISLNEDSLWSGSFRKRDNPNAYKNLEKVRKLIREGKAHEAEKLIETSFFGRNDQQRHYQPLGDLHIDLSGLSEITDYKRGLDIEKGVAFTEFVSDGVKHTREVFASFEDNVIVIKYSASGALLNLKAYIDGRDDGYDMNENLDENTVIFTVGDGIPYACVLKILSDGGKAYADYNILTAENARSVYIILSCESCFRSGEYYQKAVQNVEKAARLDYEKLCARSMMDFSEKFDRASIELPDNSEGKSQLPTDERLENLRGGGRDNKLAELYYNFSKYLMISGSREGSLPLNLQGIWNKDMWPAWGSKYTVNINTEMNYWAAEAQDLGECVFPLFDHIERMRVHGRITAREMYGCRGAVCHHNTDIWGDTAPQDRWMPATVWQMGLAWLCLHIYEHYRFTKDKKFLAEKYDTLCEAAEFFVDFLIPDDKGRLITSPSVSPENTYVTASGEKSCICEGPSMDSQILYTLFTDIIEASEILDADNKEFVEKLKEIKEKLPAPEIGKYGQIKEWSEDYDEVEIGHRHISQLFALYPAELITPEDTPELAAAARATIERRLSHGGGHTGWSRAWIINMWARLRDGKEVGENINALLTKSTADSLLDMHPPFQIDGNFGGGAGIIEAVLQSHSGRINFLPAVPEDWKEKGSVSGLRARGGFTVSFEWENGKVTKAKINSVSEEKCQVLGKYFITENGTPVDVTYKDNITEFSSKENGEYILENIG